MRTQLGRSATAGIWFRLGLAAWLAHVGRKGLAVDLSLFQDPEVLAVFREMATSHGHLLWSAGAGAGLLTALVLVGLLWVRCRGVCLFAHLAATGTTALGASWRQTAHAGQRLFHWMLRFLLVAAAGLLVALAPWLAATLLEIAGPWLAAAIAVSGTLLAAWLLAVGITLLLLRDFVVALLVQGNGGVVAAWLQLVHLMRRNPWPFIRYVIARLLLVCAAELLFFLLGLLTCCCFYVVLMTPLLWALATLPLLLFFRLLPLHFLDGLKRTAAS